MGNTYLPSINVTLNDLGLKIAPPPAGPKVTILGVTSNTGVPIREPYTVTSVEKAINSLYFQTGLGTTGRFPGEISLAIEQAINGGATNIEVMIIGHYTGDALIDYLVPAGSKATRFSELEAAYDVLRNRDLDVVFPVNAWIDYTGLDNNDSFGKQLADFCFQATQENNSCVGVTTVMPVLAWTYAHRDMLIATGFSAATGGLSGTYAVSLERALTGSPTENGYTGLIGKSTIGDEVISLFPAAASQRAVLKNILFETPSSTLVNEWHAYHTYPGDTSKFVSFIGTSGVYNPTYAAWISGAVDDQGNRLTAIPASAGAVSPVYFSSWQATDSDGNPAVDSRNIKVDAGAYISVFAAPVKGLGTQTKTLALAFGSVPSTTAYNSDGGAAYAGLINSLAPQSSTTNKFLGGLLSLKLLSARQANDMTGMRFVTMYTRSKGFVVASGVTGAHNISRYVRSDYVRLTTVRIVHNVVDLIRSVAEKYLGEANNAPAMNALDAEIGQLLITMKGGGALNAFDFVIQSTPEQRVLGELDINLTLVPAFEITKINLTVSLASSL